MKNWLFLFTLLIVTVQGQVNAQTDTIPMRQEVISKPPPLQCDLIIEKNTDTLKRNDSSKTFIEIGAEDNQSLKVETDSFNYQTEEKPDCGEVFYDPEFPGGDRELLMYIMTRVRFTDEMKNTGISGTVYIQYIVEKDGSISDIKVVKGVHELYDAEAIRLISEMPDWIPAIDCFGKPVRVRYTLPIQFELN